MNVLPADKRARILALHAAGATLREIARDVGCHRETVRALLDALPARELTDEERIAWLGVARVKIGKAVGALMAALEGMGIDPYDDRIAGPLVEIQTLAIATCPHHPEAAPWEEVDPDFGCPRCEAKKKHRIGLKRHHVRRKAEGRPVLPPWQKL